MLKIVNMLDNFEFVNKQSGKIADQIIKDCKISNMLEGKQTPTKQT